MEGAHTDRLSPNLYLVGFMGTGKSTVGQKAAHLLNMPFLDSDQEIEKRCGLKISEVFARYGEEKFRELESEFVRDLQPRSRTVISCGGGLVTQPELLGILQTMGVVIVLYASLDTLEKRLSKDMSRPLMQVDNPRERIEALWEKRRPIYQKAGVGIMTDGYSTQEVAEHVARIYIDKLKS